MENNHTYSKEELSEIRNSFWGFFTEKFRFTLVVMFGIITMGVGSYISLPQEANPEIKVPIGIVTTVYPGATANDIEKLITDEIEEEIEGLDDLDKITSSSSEGLSAITVSFLAEADIESSIRKLKDAVDDAKPDLPDDAEDPNVTEVSFEDSPVVTFSLVGEYTYEEFMEMAEIVKDELESIRGVDDVRILGERNTEIHINIDPVKMQGYAISQNQIHTALQRYHLDIPIGGIVTGKMNYQVRLEGEFDTADEIKEIPIDNRDGQSIYIKDIAEVKETLQKETVFNRLSIAGSEPESTISLSVYKKTGANIIETVNRAKDHLTSIQGNLLPTPEDGLNIQITNDNSEFVKDDFDSLSQSALQTIILIFITLLFALGFKEALITSIAIPLTFLVTFTMLQITGNTLNGLTLFGLVLGLGLLVDTAIVIMEGIYENVHVKKMSPGDAALATIKTYRTPLISGTATTVAAFLPMYLMSGIVGQFFSYIPTTVTTVLISSLFISLTISPAIAARLIRSRKEGKKRFFLMVWKDRLIQRIHHYYSRFLRYLINGRFTCWAIIGVAIVTFASAMMLMVKGYIKTESFPVADVNFFNISVEAPEGTRVEETDLIAQKVEKQLLGDPLIENFVSSVGGGSARRTNQLSSGAASNSHTANITVNLVDKDDRELGSYEVSDKYRKKFESFTDAKVSIAEIRGGPPQAAPIEVRIFGEDFKTAEEIAQDITTMLEEFGAYQIEDSVELGTGQFVFYPKIQRLNKYGLDTATVGSTIRNAVFGREAAKILRDGEKIEIWVRYDWGEAEKPLHINQIENIEIATPAGFQVPLKEIADVKLEPSFLSINHRDSDRITTVTAEAADPVAIFQKLEERLKGYQLPDGFNIEMGGQREDIDQSFADLRNALSLAILLIALILILQFNSFTQPLIILFSLPLSLIGVFYGFFFFQIKLGIAAFIGVVALAGIVVNDAIVLIDRINNNRKRGMSINDAIIEAGPARLQPILITSITTALGILPLTLKDEFWLGLGSAIIFGITFSTVLTLIVMPVLYKLFESGKERLYRRKQKVAVEENAC